jgi:hypothetical protein
MTPGTAQVADAAHSVAESRSMGWLARLGLTARGAVWLVMGWLAILLATGSSAHVDQRGALVEVLAKPFGTALVLLLALGFLAYALWRLSEAITGRTAEGSGTGPRLRSLARAVAYLVLCFSALGVLRGARGTQSGQQAHVAGVVMQHTGGRWAVGLAGAVIVVVGLVMVREGWSAKFLRYFGSLPSGSRSVVVWLGRIGTVSRGLVFAVTGVLVVVAAWTARAAQAGGIDVAVRTLLEKPYGPALVAALGAGLVVFGLYGLAEAAWRRVPGDEGRTS